MVDPIAFENVARRWTLGTRTLTFGVTPLVMGIVNVTPDSFSDGGRYLSTDAAIEHALQLVADGADILDIGGESTRPYSQPVDVQTELTRVIPVIERLADAIDIPISIDTSKAKVAEAAVAAGAEIINDVTAFAGDLAMIEVAAATGAGVCVMHMQGTPQTMQDDPQYGNVVDEILRFLARRLELLSDRGVARSRICLDPGIGFGKTHQHNWTLVRNCWRFHALGQPILVGHSRKGFIGKSLGTDDVAARDVGTLVVSLELARQRVHVVRVHNVRSTRQGFAIQADLNSSITDV